MPIFAVTLHFAVEGPSGARRAQVERVTDGYAAVEAAADHLLSSSWSYSERGGHGRAEVRLTVTAPDKAIAFERACAGFWSAIRDAGGFTPGSAEPARGPAAVVYRLTDEKVELVLG